MAKKQITQAQAVEIATTAVKKKTKVQTDKENSLPAKADREAGKDGGVQ